MNEQIDIWLVGNTGLRNPNRIQDGFKVFAGSPFVGNLHGRDNEIGFMNYLNEKGIIQNEDGKDESGSHARKWRLMFAKNGFIYPQVKKKEGKQEELGPLDDITPFGRSFLKADTYPAVQECYLRAMSVEQFVMPDGIHYFSPLRWLLAIMLELEKRTGTSELSRIEFALWGHTTNPSYNLSDVVDRILDLRKRRATAPAKRPFDKKEIAERGKSYDKKADNFLDYSDMNMRYLRISGVLQRKGRGLIIVPAKHVMAEKLAKSTASAEPIMEQYKLLCNGAPLPTDNRIKEMYKNLGIPAPDSIVRWDIAATFISRIKDENLIFDTYEDVRRKKEISMDEISLGFKLLSSIYAQGMSNKQVSELEQNESIKWESDIDELLQQLNTVCSILLADTFFKFYQSWKRPITKLMGNAIALEFLTIMWLDWKDRGCPSTVSGETKALQRDARILFDKLVFEYATKTWRGSGDSKMSSDIKNWKQRVTPVDSEDWKNFITGACMGNYNGQDTTVKILKPVLYYYYVITSCSPINQVNVSFDVDHIIPKERFVGNNMVAQTYRDSLINLSFSEEI